MGREIAEAVPEAMEVYRIGSEATGMDPRAPLLRGAARRARRDRGTAAHARRDEPRDPRRRSARLVSSPTSSSATRSASSPRSRRSARCPTARRSASSASAGWLWPLPRESAPARWPRSSGSKDHLVETLCRKILGVWPRTTTAPGQIVVSGENDAVEECCAEAESLGARRADPPQGLRRVPQPARRAGGRALKPAIDRIRFSDPSSPSCRR
jgi:hypothetical protein